MKRIAALAITVSSLTAHVALAQSAPRESTSPSSPTSGASAPLSVDPALQLYIESPALGTLRESYGGRTSSGPLVPVEGTFTEDYDGRTQSGPLLPVTASFEGTSTAS